jgi:uncharacterized protein YjiK
MIILYTVLILFTISLSIESDTSLLSHYFQNNNTSKSVILPKKLREISGLAMTQDGRLFAHDDETSNIYQVDYHTGDIVKSFIVGAKKLKKEDFEGLAIVKEKFYLVTSDGKIFEFEEGADGEKVKHKIYKTWLKDKYDVEGLCYDPMTHKLLLACKGFAGKRYSDVRAVYAFMLDEKKLLKEPHFLLPKKIFKEDSSFVHTIGEFFLLPVRNFAPSGIERHPKTGTFFIVSAKGHSLIEVSPQGTVLGRVVLHSDQHKQPEGITFSPEYGLLISDEGRNSSAKITFYPYINNSD